MRSEDIEREVSRLPQSFAEMRPKVLGRDDGTMYEGIERMGVDAVLAHLVDVLLPAAFEPEAPAEPRGVLQLELSTPAGERHLSIARTGSGLEARAGHAQNPEATVSMTLANLLRLLVNEPGKDAGSQVASKAMHVTGDVALARALPSWLRLPG